jgi:hypothetical protein
VLLREVDFRRSVSLVIHRDKHQTPPCGRSASWWPSCEPGARLAIDAESECVPAAGAGGVRRQ